MELRWGFGVLMSFDKGQEVDHPVCLPRSLGSKSCPSDVESGLLSDAGKHSASTGGQGGEPAVLTRVGGWARKGG